MDKVKTCGVYVLSNSITGERYVGSSIWLEARKRGHFTDLKRGVHRNPNLQRSYDQYGKDAFKFTVIECCNEDILIEREQHWMDTLHPEFNINKKAGQVIEDYIRTEEATQKRKETYCSNFLAGKHKKRNWTPPTGPAHPNYGKPMSEEQKKKISNALKGEKNPGYGKKRDPESVRKGAEKRARTYVGLVDPDGNVYAPIHNLSAFCQEHGLHVSHALAVLHDRLNHHQGWTKYNPDQMKG